MNIVEPKLYTFAPIFIISSLHNNKIYALEKPLVTKRLPEELAAKVAEYIPVRSPLTKHQCGADEAVSDYHKQIVDVANLILAEYRQVPIIYPLIIL